MKKYFLIAIFVLINIKIYSQQNNTQSDTSRKDAIKIFIDCDFCDMQFIMKEITFVNYTRDYKDAQVHILITRQSTGSGGKEYDFIYSGQLDLKGLNDTLVQTFGPSETEDEIRQGYLKTLKLGLIRYVARSPLLNKISINYTSVKKDEVIEDKWNSWIFNLNFSGYLNGQKSYKYKSMYGSFSASKVTPDWKINFNLSNSYNQNNYQMDEGELVSISRSNYFDGLIVRSIDDHWSYGGNFSFYNSSYSNIKFSTGFYPAIEYDLFPYSKSNLEQLRFNYNIGPNYRDYVDTTIYDKISETLIQQRLSIAFEFKEKWGSFSTSLTGSTYLHDLSKNSIDLFAVVKLKIMEGLSFSIVGSGGLVHNQLSLPSGGASKDEILLQRKELETSYNYFGAIGISYTFGSTINNIVNPRFGTISSGGMNITVSN